MFKEFNEDYKSPVDSDQLTQLYYTQSKDLLFFIYSLQCNKQRL